MSTARLEEVRASFLADLESAAGDAAAVEAVRVHYAGRRSGLLNELTAVLRELPNEGKRNYGRGLNELKKEIAAKLADAKTDSAETAITTTKSVVTASRGAAAQAVDVTLPGTPLPRGAQHPVHIVRRRI